MTARPRQLGLDVLRGVAILLVIGAHLEYARPDGLVGMLADAWHRAGWVGVDLFFVLSGFLISGLLLGELRRTGRLRIGRFLSRRALKIYPAYFVFIAYVMLSPVFDTWQVGGDVGATLRERWSLGWPNLVFLQNYIGENPWRHTWSLAVEDHFYLVLPLLLVALAAWQRLKLLPTLALVVAGICLTWRTTAMLIDPAAAGFIYEATHFRFDALLLGVALRVVREETPSVLAPLMRYPFLAIVIGLALWTPTVLYEWRDPFIISVGLTATAFGSASILLGVLEWGDRWRRARPSAVGLARIGVCSYSIYLWHVTAVRIAEQRLGPLVDTMVGSPTARWLAIAMVATAAAVVVGIIATRVVEAPVLALRERIVPPRDTAPLAKIPTPFTQEGRRVA